MPKNPTSPSLPLRESTVQEQSLGHEVLLYHQTSGQVGVLNRTAHFIWQQCDGTRSVADISAAVRARFDTAAEPHIEAQVAATVARLHAAGLLVDGSPGGGPPNAP